jgi:hypothetical protein
MFVNALFLIAGLLSGGPAANPPDPISHDTAASDEPFWDTPAVGSCGCSTTCPPSIIENGKYYYNNGCLSVKSQNYLVCFYRNNTTNAGPTMEHSCEAN